MKYILTLLCFVWFSASAQEPAYTPMRLNYQFRGIRVDSLFLIPQFSDTTSANTTTIKNIAGAMIRTGNDFWMRNSTTTAWLQNVNVGNGASVNVQFVDSVYRKLGKDSIFWRKGGVEYKLKDSIGNLASLGLQQVTDNGDSTKNPVVFYTGPVNGYNGWVKIGVGNVLQSGIGSIVGIYGDSTDATPHKIELYAGKGDGYNYFTMESAGTQFNVINGNGATSMQSNGNVSLSANKIMLGDEFVVDTSNVYIGYYAGNGNTGRNVQPFGDSAAKDNIGNHVVALDSIAAYGNTGSNVIAIGSSAGYQNTGDNVNFFGENSGVTNSYDHVTLFGQGSIASASNQVVFTTTNGHARISVNVNTDRELAIPTDVDGTFKVTNYAEPNLTSNNYTIDYPGTYLCNNGSTGDLQLPDFALMLGQTITVWNNSGGTIGYTGSYIPVDASASAINTITDSVIHLLTATNDGWVKTN